MAYQNDYGHDGAQPGDSLKPPLVRRWTLDLGGLTSYPLIAGGRVFVVANFHAAGTSARVYAIDAASGSVLWTHDLGPDPAIYTTLGAALAYDGGRVFAIDTDDQKLRAFDAASGTQLWQFQAGIGGSDIPSPPTAVAGTVYFQDANWVYAIREADGSQVWRSQANSDANGPPAVDAQDVYEGYPCSGAYAWAADSGALQWKNEPCYGGGGGGTPALHSDKLYIRGMPSSDTPTIYDAGSGTQTGRFSASKPPAFDGGTGFFVTGGPSSSSTGGTLSSVDLGSQATNWTFTGDGGLNSNVLVVNGYVYVGSTSGNVYALQESDGQQSWSDNAGAPVSGPHEGLSEGPTAGLAIGEGLLAVPASNLLSVYATCDGSCAPGGTTAVQPPGPAGNFYFAEGSTASGYSEQLRLLSPHASGPAVIDFFTPGGETTATVQLAAGQPATVDVASVVGAGQDVAAHVRLPGPGTAERFMHVQSGSRQATIDKVGLPAPQTGFGFAAGSTASTTDEYLSLLNPGTAAATVSLRYAMDGSSTQPTKTLVLQPQTRTTVEVFSGDPSADVSNCVPSGTGASCGVGRGQAGVSVTVVGQNNVPFVAERTLYLNGYDFGGGPIYDGDSSFGGSGEYFVAGSTLPGFNEHLVLFNPSNYQVTADIFWNADGSKTEKEVPVPAGGRHDVDVSDPNEGVGPGHSNVSAVVHSLGATSLDVDGVMYVVHDFGSGTVAGVQTIGTGSATITSGFASASTLAGDASFLTVSATDGAALVTVALDAGAGPVRRIFTVPAGAAATIALSDSAQGIGAGNAQVSVVVTASMPVVVNVTTYSTNAATSGATDTFASTPAIDVNGNYRSYLEFF